MSEVWKKGNREKMVTACKNFKKGIEELDAFHDDGNAKMQTLVTSYKAALNELYKDLDAQKITELCIKCSRGSGYKVATYTELKKCLNVDIDWKKFVADLKTKYEPEKLEYGLDAYWSPLHHQNDSRKYLCHQFEYELDDIKDEETRKNAKMLLDELKKIWKTNAEKLEKSNLSIDEIRRIHYSVLEELYKVSLFFAETGSEMIYDMYSDLESMRRGDWPYLGLAYSDLKERVQNMKEVYKVLKDSLLNICSALSRCAKGEEQLSSDGKTLTLIPKKPIEDIPIISNDIRFKNYLKRF